MNSRSGAVITAAALASLLGVGELGAQSSPASPKGQSPPRAAAPATPAKSAEPVKDTKRFAEHTGLMRSSAVVGSTVKDLAGKDAGKIEDLLVDHRGDVAYAIISFGGFMGIGDKLYAVPWNAVIVDRDKRVVHVDVRKETLERTPNFPPDKWPDPNDREWGREVRKAWSDASITAAVKTKLAGTSPSTLLKVDVDTNQGVVQLNGTVDNERTKQRATELARQVDGVRRVVNNLKVQG
jgi:BON domain-containing protein/PRC-barrel domain protein